MKLTTVITLGAVFVLLASVYVLNRPRLNSIDATIPQNFPSDGFSHEVFEQLLQTYVDDAGHVDYESWHNSSDSMGELSSYLAAVAAIVLRIRRTDSKADTIHWLTGCMRTMRL